MRKFLTVAFTAIVLLTMGWVAGQSEPKEQEAQGALEIYDCKVLWKDKRIISSKIPGIVQEILVQDGDPVKPGEVLARLDAREAKIEHGIQQLLGSVISELTIERADALVDEYSTRRDTAKVLFQLNSMSEEEKRLAEVQVTINKIDGQLEVEKSKTEKLKTDRLVVMVDDHTIRSPMNGIVRKSFKREREAVTAGEDLRLFEVVDTNVVRIEGLVKVKHLYEVHKGQTVSVQLVFDDANLPEEQQSFAGVVVFVDPNVHDVSQKFWIRAEVQNPAGTLHEGLRATMRINLDGPPTSSRRVARP